MVCFVGLEGGCLVFVVFFFYFSYPEYRSVYFYSVRLVRSKLFSVISWHLVLSVYNGIS